jgi:NHL repeat
VFAVLAAAAAMVASPVAATAVTDPDKPPPPPVSTLVGTGNNSFGGDGGPAAAADLNRPRMVAPAPGGGLLIADTDNDRIRKVEPDGLITTVAGTGNAGYNGDALLPTLADLDEPRGVAGTADGGFLIADTLNHRVRKVLLGGALVVTVAGNGVQGFGGDGLAASLAQLDSPSAVAPTADGGFLIADTGNNRIRKVSPTGLISTVAGDGTAAYGGDGGQATAAQLNEPMDVKPLPEGGFVVADTKNHAIREVAENGTIATIAGNGTNGFSGDKGPGTAAQLHEPEGVAVADTDFYVIADTKNHRLRKLKRGEIKTVAGDGNGAFSGDGGPAEGAQLNSPAGLFRFPGAETVVVADVDNHRIRAMGLVDLAEVVIPEVEVPPVIDLGLDPPGTSGLPTPEPPKVGQHVQVKRKKGRVRVRLPGALEFTTLEDSASVPVNSVVNAAGGTVAITSARDLSGATQTASFTGALFAVAQRRSSRPVTELVLRGGNFRACRAGRARTGVVANAAWSRRRIRRLWGSGKGRFRTRGRHGAATVRGTKWVTSDRCDGTLVVVRRGKVAVRDFRRRKTVMLRAGGRYLARRTRRR